jgi:hypothetical protein
MWYHHHYLLDVENVKNSMLFSLPKIDRHLMHLSYFLVISVHPHYHLGSQLNKNFVKTLRMAN